MKYLREKQEAKDAEEERKRKRKEEREIKKRAKEGGKRKQRSNNTEEDIDLNICPECKGTYSNDPDDWVGCCHCERWLHIVCTHVLEGLSDKDIVALDCKCHFC